MKDWKKIVIDSPEMWPQSTHVDLEEPFIDDRGSLQLLVNTPMKSIALITSVAGAVRANHFHLDDWHYMYMLNGEAEYHYRPSGSDEAPKVVMWRTGELVFTPPMEEHTTVFTQDSTFLAMSRHPRDQESYEADVRRVQLVDPNSVKL